MKTLRQLAQDALDVQDASNLSGVVKGFDQAIADLKGNLPNLGSYQINNHPIVRIWVDKLASLAGLEQGFLSHEYRMVNVLAGIDKQ